MASFGYAWANECSAPSQICRPQARLAIDCNAMSSAGADDGFWRDGYQSADALVTPQQCAFLRQCMDMAQKRGEMQSGNNGAYSGPNNQYAPFAGQKLLAALADRVGALVGCAVLPSYSYWRIYERGAVLNRHKDRKACEVSLTIQLAAEPEGLDWPIRLTDLHGEEQSVALPAGAGLLYQGIKVPHWRDALEGERQYQIFLHYVVADGPHAAHAGDALGDAAAID